MTTLLQRSKLWIIGYFEPELKLWYTLSVFSLKRYFSWVFCRFSPLRMQVFPCRIEPPSSLAAMKNGCSMLLSMLNFVGGEWVWVSRTKASHTHTSDETCNFGYLIYLRVKDGSINSIRPTWVGSWLFACMFQLDVCLFQGSFLEIVAEIHWIVFEYVHPNFTYHHLSKSCQIQMSTFHRLVHGINPSL